MHMISPSTRIRRSPFYDATVAEGVASFTVYNRMLLPTSYGDPEGEYWRLINGVSLWDVAAERQIQLAGRDAARLAQILAPRDLTKCTEGHGRYIALCNHDGTLINDPILLKLTDDCFWLSIADSNILFWARAIAAERGLDVAVTEPDVSPLAIQGPLAEEVVASVFGDWTRSLKRFHFAETHIDDIPVVVARSGWSKQGGFEIFLMDGTKGNQVWNLLREAGKPWDMAPGTPNHSERIEGGLISCGGDTDDQTNPFEIGLDRFVDLNGPDDIVGIEALRRIKATGPSRHNLGVILDDVEPTDQVIPWFQITRDGTAIGHMTNWAWSYRLQKTIGFALVSSDCRAGEIVGVSIGGRKTTGKLTDLPFL